MKRTVYLSAVLLLSIAFALAGCKNTAKTAAAGLSSAAGAAAKRSYTIAYTQGEPDRGKVKTLDIDKQMWLEPVDISAHAQLCYNDTSLYVHMWAEEKDIRAEHPKTDLLANTYEDSCLEFFLLPVTGDARYMNFEFNPNGCVCAEIGKTKAGRIRLVPADDPYEAVCAYTGSGWEITYRIPFAFIREFYPDFSAASGKQIYANFYKCGNLTAKKHYIAWNPLTSPTPDFHRPEDFGILIFG